jgi:hypothetical protein
MDDPDHQPNASSKPKPTSGSPTRAEKAGGSIDGVLKTLSRKELYSMMKQHGIAEVDPLEADPSDKVAPIKHMHNMVKLKKLVETNPHILNMDENFSTHAHEAERKEGMDEQQSRVQSVKDFMDSMSSDLKHSIADKYSDHPIMQNRIKSEHAHVDKMHKISALRKIFESHPDIMEKHKKDADHESLMNLTIGNKNMGKVLRNFLKFKGVGDVKNVEPGVEWSYETGFVRREQDEKGNPILSVVDTGKDGEEWNEHSISLSDVKDFLQGSKKGESVLKSLDQYDILNWRW